MQDINLDELEASAELSVDTSSGNQSQPRHTLLVQAMLAQGFCIVGGMPAIPDGESYRFGWNAIHHAMLLHDSWSTERTRKEALKTLSYIAPALPVANHRYIGFKNGVFDVLSDTFFSGAEFQAKGLGIVPIVIPHTYDCDADVDEAIETLLDGISCKDESVRENLEETAGLVMSRYADNRSSAVWMYGTGENGKSTFLAALEYLVGAENTCAMPLDDMKGQFNNQMMVGKLLCISDDQPAGSIDKNSIGVIKKVVTGQPIKIEAKGKDPYNATMFSTIVVTSNEPPTYSDTTHGSLRRWHMIPLNANFGDSDDRDVDLAEKLQTEHAAQWLIKLGLDGLKRIIENEGLTETEYSRTAIQEAKERSNSVYAFLAEHPREEILSYPNVEVWYWRYQDFSKNQGCRPFDMRAFVRMVNTEYNLETANSGRYTLSDSEVKEYDGIAWQHGKRAGDQFRKFIEKT